MIISKSSYIISLVFLSFTMSVTGAEFYRGVNLGGPAVSINGNLWEGDDAKNFVCKDRLLVLKNQLQLNPETDEAHTKMLHSFRWHTNAQVQFTDIQTGIYSVWFYIVEDNNPETFDIFAENILAVRSFNSGSKGTWKKVGPIVVEVDDGFLNLSAIGGAANLCGIEVWKGAFEGSKILSPPKPPSSPFVGKFANQKPRIIVMTDIGGDPDDQQSLVRYLLYTCDFKTEGFCTGFGWGHEKQTRPDLIKKAINAYGKVLPNLLKHRSDYPSAESLLALLKDGHNGNPHSVGEGMDSEASNWIIKVLEKDDPRPVWFSIWGGPRELAQAIWKMEKTKNEEEFKHLKSKIRIHSIADQDRTAGWIKRNHPDVFYLYSNKLYKGVWNQGNQEIVSPKWLKKHVLANHGPLGAPDIYPPNAAGKKGVKEGDTPSFFGVLRNGLSDPEAPEWGGWGGRFKYSGKGSEFIPASDYIENKPNIYYTIWRWREAYQNEFEARMDWCIKPFKEANHAPVAICNNQKGVGTIFLKANPGEKISLSAKGSQDPDGNKLNFNWWVYHEPSSIKSKIILNNSKTESVSIEVPKNSKGKTIHIILEVTDNDAPALTAYRRVILKIQ